MSIPPLESNLPRAVIAAWHVEPGDTVAFGQPLCDLAVSERVRIRSVGRADALIKVVRRKKKLQEFNETEQGRFHLVFQVRASEPAAIVDRLLEEGAEVEVGDLIAVAESDPEAAMPDAVDAESVADAPQMRVVASLAPEEAL